MYYETGGKEHHFNIGKKSESNNNRQSYQAICSNSATASYSKH